MNRYIASNEWQLTDFLVLPAAREVPESSLFAVHRLNDVTLLTGSNLPVNRVADDSGQQIGWVLGWPIDLDQKTIVSARPDAPLRFSGDLDRVRERVSAWAGRFAVILLSEHTRVIFTDAGGALSVCYCGVSRIVGSRPALVAGDREPDPTRKQQLNALTEQSGDWYPAGQSAWPSIQMLLPNHELLLSEMTARRVSSPQNPGTVSDERRPTRIPETIEQVRKILTAQIESLTSNGELYIALTAGQDSRMLLSVCRDYLSRVKFFTNVKNLDQNSADREIPAQLAHEFSLNYQTVSDLQELPARNHPIALGYGGEVTAAFYWSRRWRDILKPLSTINLCSRLQYGMDCPEFIQRAMTRWKKSLGSARRDDVLDRLYQEFRLGCTMGPALAGYDAHCQFALFPFNHSWIFENARKLPRRYRYGGTLRKDICAAAWPELQSLPYG